MAATARKVAAVVPLKAVKGRRIRGHLVGRIVGHDERGPLVDYPGNPHGLRRNGRVVIRGAYVETRSRGVNRIKGGSVQIN